MINTKKIGNTLILSIQNEKSTHALTVPYLDNNNMIIDEKENKPLNVFLLNANSFLHGVFTTENDNKILIITNLFTKIEFRGNKYASKLLNSALNEARLNNCKYITLTDCTDLFNNHKNIYLKNGFSYVEEGSPEMTFVL
jgi:hypothetical protein